MNQGRRLLSVALLTQLVGAALALLVVGRTWQTVTVARPAPLGTQVDHVSGHSLDAAITGLAIVALAGLVAVFATRGLWRRGLGVLLALCGVLVAWRAVRDLAAVSPARARALASSAHGGVGIDASSVTHVSVAAAWPALSVLGGVLIAAAGVLIAVKGASWAGMSSRYEAPAARRDVQADGDVALWQALDRGDDPTRN